ncbi:MAG: ELWxxDGT repeat protein [Phycisphaerales bacterium]
MTLSLQSRRHASVFWFAALGLALAAPVAVGQAPALPTIDVHACPGGAAGAPFEPIDAPPPAMLLKDINTGPGGALGGDPASLCRVNAQVFFSALNPHTGRELWATDGTPAGTRLVRDIRVGNICSIPEFLVAFNGKVYFTANDGFSGIELWASDGTVAGTTLVKDINPGSGASVPRDLAVLSPTLLLFSADNGVNGRELWVSNGTGAGTMLLKDINTTAGASGIRTDVSGGGGGRFRVVGSTLFFAADSGTTGAELWKTDGTAVNTVLVKNINTAAGFGGMDALVEEQVSVNGVLAFTADDGINGEELWVSNGTTAGTVLVKNIAPGAQNPSYPNSLKVVGTSPTQLLYFSAADGNNNYELWRTDGTTPNTFITKEVGAGITASNPLPIDAVGSTLYFCATDDGTTNYELYATQGTGATTALVKDIVPGSGGSAPFPGLALGGNLLFCARDATAGNFELNISGGTGPTTSMLKDINVGAAGSFPQSYIALGSSVLFIANDGVHGTELWITDGTAGGTTLLGNTASDSSASNPSGFAALGDGRALFAADNGTSGEELWQTDGTDAGTALVTDIAPGSPASNPVAITPITPGSPLSALFAKVGGAQTLVSTNATGPGTFSIATTGTIPALPTTAAVNGRVYFHTSNGLWFTNGTAGGTARVANAPTGPALTGAQSVTAFGDKVLFFGANGDVGYEPFVVNASAPPALPGPPTMLKNIGPGPLASTTAGANQPIVRHDNGLAYFLAIEALTTRLWRTDGTPANTVAVQIVPADFPATTPLVSTGSRLFFVAGTAATPSGSELWTSNGSIGSGNLVADLTPGSGGSSIANLIACDGSAYFTATTPGTSRTDLYMCSDGSTLVNLTAGLNGGLPAGATAGSVRCASRIVFFSLDDGASGAELWRTNGTVEGTFMVADVEPGPLGTRPMLATALSSSRVVFSAETETTARELFLLGLCATDYNRDGNKNPDDLGDYITAYFTDPADPRTEWNGDGVTNPDDLGDYITEYYSDCV